MQTGENSLDAGCRCPDCHVAVGECHDPGCDVERCSVCRLQWISCGHEQHDPSKARWTGVWPGEAECKARGWYAVLVDGYWRACSADTLGAHYDLNRWTAEGCPSP